jgi:hypothetical protein
MSSRLAVTVGRELLGCNPEIGLGEMLGRDSIRGQSLGDTGLGAIRPVCELTGALPRRAPSGTSNRE